MNMPTNVLAVGLFAVTAAFLPTGIWFLKLKPFATAPERKIPIERAFATAIGGVGVYAFMAGFYLMAASPLRDPYNEFFGTIHLLYGLVLIVGAISLGKEWDLRPASYLAFLVGLVSVLYVNLNETLIHNVSYTPIFSVAALVGLTAPAGLHP